MTEPTYDELAKLFTEETGFDVDDFPAAILGFACAVLAKWGTPQPVVREPLTDEQRNAIYDKHCFLGDNGWEINWWQVIDEVEAAHGIKGGQHGIE